jgi:hypothetical protein
MYVKVCGPIVDTLNSVLVVEFKCGLFHWVSKYESPNFSCEVLKVMRG